jgi:hypothetical protein
MYRPHPSLSWSSAAACLPLPALELEALHRGFRSATQAKFRVRAAEWVRRSGGCPSPSTDYMPPNYQKNADNTDILTNGGVQEVRRNVSLSAMSGQSLEGSSEVEIASRRSI